MSAERVLALLRQRPSLTAAEIAAELGVSQPTVSRVIGELGPRVVRIGRARSTRYAAVRPIGPHGARWPLFRIDADGKPHEVAELAALAHDRTMVASDSPLLGEGAAREGWFDGIPWFLHDARPQGFLGRIVARRLGPLIGAPADPTLWNNDHALSALLVDGDDLPGDLVLGENMLERVLSPRRDREIAQDAREASYLERADAALVDDVVGSSAGGEQPKFTARVRAGDGTLRHVIVKFTDRGESPGRRRWHDLLVCEQLASECLSEAGIEAARSSVVEGERTFLEAPRFDRIGERGRRGYVTLAALDNALHGARDDWRRAAERLERDGWIDADAARVLRLLHYFGRLIANTDMHFHNVSFARGESRPLALAPVYDMLPMLYRPAATGEVVAREFVPAPPTPRDAPVWQDAARIARAFWERVADDARVSDGFRAIAGANGARLRALG